MGFLVFVDVFHPLSSSPLITSPYFFNWIGIERRFHIQYLKLKIFAMLILTPLFK